MGKELYLLTVKEYCKLTGLPGRTVRTQLQAGQIPKAYKNSSGRTSYWKIPVKLFPQDYALLQADLPPQPPVDAVAWRVTDQKVLDWLRRVYGPRTQEGLERLCHLNGSGNG